MKIDIEYKESPIKKVNITTDFQGKITLESIVLAEETTPTLRMLTGENSNLYERKFRKKDLKEFIDILSKMYDQM